MTRNRKSKKDKIVRLSDEELAVLADEYKTLQAQLAKLEKRKGEVSKLIIGEIDARNGDGSIEVPGFKITKTQQTISTYNVDKLRERLSTRLFRSVTVPVVDKVLLSAAVQAGDISITDAAYAEEETKRSPYPSITRIGGE